MKTMRATLMKVITIVVIAAVVIGTGFVWYTDYQAKVLENGAYKYLEHNLYGYNSDIEVTDIVRGDDGRYEIDYTYTSSEGRDITGVQYDVEL